MLSQFWSSESSFSGCVKGGHLVFIDFTLQWAVSGDLEHMFWGRSEPKKPCSIEFKISAKYRLLKWENADGSKLQSNTVGRLRVFLGGEMLENIRVDS